ncbi:cytochrome P450 [Plantactinospora sp. BC1]|uniref:cytochrome P450 n=1 Tax=Plantactinospora sp. BC1 TaxID=2108470 RepID=UPI000D1525F6|nr:cytochrome P450 [Plantactinospora sp. BC1]AVT33704.1 cytochrome P450 [Plantactinospora sp. BC1]
MSSSDREACVSPESEIVDLYQIRDEFYRDPHAVMKSLQESGPVHRVRLPNDLDAWLVVGADVIRELLSEPTFVSGPRFLGVAQEDTGGSSTLGMLTCDEPRHGQLRSLVASTFKPREVARLEPGIEAIANDLLDRLREGEEVDLVEAFAYRLTLEVIIEILGVSSVDRAAFRRWTNETVVDGDDSAAIRAARRHLEDVLARTLREGDGSTLVERIANAGGTADAPPISFDELVSMTYLLLIAGHESATNLIANTLVTVLNSEELVDQIRAGSLPFEELVEESLRFDPPLMISTSRITTCPVSAGGRTIPGGGERVFLAWAAAERDPSVVPDSDTFDPHRRRTRTLAFGGGGHYCLGANLARLEATVALRTLFRRFPSMELVKPPQRWRSTVTRGIESLFVRL